MFQLQIANNDATSGSVQVSWCLDLETLNLLASKNVKDPVVLLISAPAGEAYSRNKEFRTAVPLKDLVAYVELRSPGINNIFGMILSQDLGHAKDDNTKMYRGKYIHQALNHWGSDVDTYNPWFVVGSEPIQVDVPKGCFAKEPSDLEKRWVNLFLTEKCVDQCEFRKKRLFAYSLQPILMLFNYLARTVMTLVAYLFAQKGANFDLMVDPLSTSLDEDGLLMFNGTYLINKSKTGFRKYWKLVFMPAALLFMATLVWLLSRFHLWKLSSIVVFGLLATVLVVFVSLCLYSFIKETLRLRDIKQSNETPWYMNEEDMSLIVCGDKTPLTFETLPEKRKTIRLRFQNLKSKVCRPFSV